MRGEFLIDAIAQFLERVAEVIEQIAPERRNLAVRFTKRGLQCFSGEHGKDARTVTTNQHDLVDQTEIEVFEYTVTVGVDGQTLERTTLIPLDVKLQDAALVDTFVDFHTG